MSPDRRESDGARTVVAVGLTGGIGAGKSTALALFAECGARVVSADELVHGLYGRPEVVRSLVHHFGPDILGTGGAVERSRLADAVRGRLAELRWLEELTHPLVADGIRQLVERSPKGSVVVCEVPLLFEAGHEGLFDLLVTIEADSEIRRRRSTHRFGLELFAELEGRQTTSERRVRDSDLAFVNDGGLADLREFVRSAYERAQGMLQEG